MENLLQALFFSSKKNSKMHVKYKKIKAQRYNNTITVVLGDGSFCFFVQKRNEKIWAKSGAIVGRLELPVLHYAFGAL